jgi:hypothetical protein
MHSAIIHLLPEIMTDRERPFVFQWMEETMDQDWGLWGSYLQVLPSLVLLHPDLQARAIDQVTAKLDAIAVADIPAVVRFLIDSASTPDIADDVAAKLRARLHCLPGLDPHATAPDRKAKGPASAASAADARLVDALRMGLLVQPLVAAAFQARISAAVLPAAKKKRGSGGDGGGSDDDSEGELAAPGPKILDVWVLLVLRANATTPSARGDVDTLFRKGFDASAWPEALLRQAIATRSDALGEMLPSLLAVAGSMLRGPPGKPRKGGRGSTAAQPPSVGAAAGGALLYTLAWEAFRSNSKRQDVLAAMASHASGTAAECAAALGALCDIACADPGGMAVFRSYLIGLLDATDRVDEASARRLFQLMAHLAAGACTQQRSGPDGSLDDGMRELHIMLRKQLNHPFPHLRRLGVLGTAAYAARLATAPGDGPRLAVAALEAGVQAAQDRACCSMETLLLDELCAVVPSLRAATTTDSLLIGWLDAHVKLCLDGCMDNLQHSPAALQQADELWPWLNLEGDASAIAFSIAARATLMPYNRPARLGASHEGDSKGMEGGRMCALLRMTAALKGETSSIGGALGAPLRMPSLRAAFTRQLGGSVPAESCLPALVLAACWLRELLNVYSLPLPPHQRAGDVDARLFQRLRALVALEALIEEGLVAYPGALAALPRLGVSYGQEQAQSKPAAGAKPKKAAAAGEGASRKGKRKAEGSAGGSKKAAKKPKSKKKKRQADVDMDDDEEEEDDVEDEEEDQPPAAPMQPAQETAVAVVVPPGWRAQLLRPLNLSAVSCLAIPEAVANALLPCEEPLPSGAAALPGAALLLNHLAACASQAMTPVNKFKGRASASTAALPGGASVEEVVATCCALLPVHVQTHMRAAIAILQAARTAAGESPVDLPLLAAPGGEPAAVSAHSTSPLAAAQGVHTALCSLLRTLFSWPELTLPARAPLLRAVLHALSESEDEHTSLATTSSESIVELMPLAFTFLKDTFVPAHCSTFAASMDGMKLLAAACKAAQALSELPQHGDLDMGALRQELSLAASEVLMSDFWLEPGGMGKGGAQKGSAMKYLLTLQVQNAADPLAELTQLTSSYLPAVADLKETKAAHVSALPSLTAKTLSVWYAVAWAEAVRQLAAWARAASVKSVTQSPAQCEAQLHAGQVLAKHAASLASITKAHAASNILLTVAIRSGGKAVRALLRAGPLFEGALSYDKTRALVSVFFKEVQAFTRLLHVQCTEASQRGVAGLAVPATKRDLEHFLLVVTAAVDGAGGGGLTIGQLKHKSITGEEMPSQFQRNVPDDSDDSDDEDGDGEEDEDIEDGEEEDADEEEEEEKRRREFEADRRKTQAAAAVKAAAKTEALRAAAVAAKRRNGSGAAAGPPPPPAAAHGRKSGGFSASDEDEEEEEGDADEDEEDEVEDDD